MRKLYDSNLEELHRRVAECAEAEKAWLRDGLSSTGDERIKEVAELENRFHEKTHALFIFLMYGCRIGVK